jgi:hypothetical protein
MQSDVKIVTQSFILPVTPTRGGPNLVPCGGSQERSRPDVLVDWYSTLSEKIPAESPNEASNHDNFSRSALCCRPGFRRDTAMEEECVSAPPFY